MKIRRCACLLLEPRESLRFDLATLFAGQTALAVQIECVALAGHLEQPVPLDDTQRTALLAYGESSWVDYQVACDGHGQPVIDALINSGLLLVDELEHSAHRQRDDLLRSSFWHPLSAVYHAASRWRGEDTANDPHSGGFRDVAEMVAAYGAPPAVQYDSLAATGQIVLPAPSSSAFEALLRRRRTCRNFDAGKSVGLQQLATVLHRSFGAQDTVEIAPGAQVFKKFVPSGGSLHPIEAFVLVQRVDTLAPGLYHYRAASNGLEQLQVLKPETARTLARRAVAGQAYFLDAPVLVFLVARFIRNFWKYRRHVKALRAIHLDAGHLSQMLYLTAAEEGLGAFVTAAINEQDIGDALQLDTLAMGPVAVCGFGPHDPAGEVIEMPSLTEPLAPARSGL